MRKLELTKEDMYDIIDILNVALLRIIDKEETFICNAILKQEATRSDRIIDLTIRFLKSQKPTKNRNCKFFEHDHYRKNGKLIDSWWSKSLPVSGPNETRISRNLRIEFIKFLITLLEYKLEELKID